MLLATESRQTWLLRAFVAAILISNFGVRCLNLAHPSLKPLDEVFHAIVARHLATHPLFPTLNENNYLPVPPGEWQNAGIWLHKPPMALWQIAVSFRFFGVNTLALRLPSAIFATLAAWLTYCICRLLFDPLTACVALVLQAFNPVIEMLVHGYVFSDHIDIGLLFWTELSILLMIRLATRNSRGAAMLCGAAQGVAFLSKTYPALITTALAGGIVLWPMLDRTSPRRLSMANFGWLFFATLLVAGPWNVYAAMNWPNEFWAENLGILAHLNQNVEGWAAPWDRVIADYGWRIFHVLYPATIAAFIMAAGYVIRRRDPRVGFVLAWASLTLVPNLLATSKPMTATLVGWPAMFILLAWLVAGTVRGQVGSAVALLVVTLLPVLWNLGTMPVEGWGYPSNYHFGSILISHWRPVAAGALAAITGLMSGCNLTRWPWISRPALAGLLLLLVWPINRAPAHSYLNEFWRVSTIRTEPIADETLVAFAATLPRNGVLLVDEQAKLENKIVAFWSDRDCYPWLESRWQADADTIVANGGKAFVVSHKFLNLPVIWQDASSERRIYAYRPK